MKTRPSIFVITVFTLIALTFSTLGTNPALATIDTSSFAPKVDFATGSTPSSVAIADFDLDGKPDMVVINGESSTMSFFRNTSTLGAIDATSFAAKIDFQTGSIPSDLAVGDLDGDGKLDVVVANSNSKTFSVFRNTSTGGSITASPFSSKVDFATGNSPLGAAIGDVDGDGKPDIAITNAGDSNVSVYRNLSISGIINSSSFSNWVNFVTGATPARVVISDLNGDGKRDMAITNNASDTMSILRNTSTSGEITTSSFAPKEEFSTGHFPSNIAVGDLDGDGKPDIAVTNGGTNTISLYRNTSTTSTINSGSFAPKVDISTGSAAPSGIVISDLDLDGKLDLAVSEDFSHVIAVFWNNSTVGTLAANSFFQPVEFAVVREPGALAVGDIDGDGKPDMAAPNQGNNTVSVLRNTATPIFADVPFSNFANFFIEILFRSGISGGCNTNPLLFCPDAPVTRAQMAIFILRGMHGSSFVPPPATGTVFGDVPANAFAANFIEQLAAEGITSGCGGGNYCPDASVTRAQMAIFLLRGEHGSAFIPPTASGTVFTDVPAGSFAADFIEQLAAENITGGCGGGNYCPNATVTRAQMAIFLVRTFILP